MDDGKALQAADDWLRKRLEWWDSQYVAMPTIAPNGGPVTGPTQVSITSTGGTTFTDTALLASGAPAKALVPTSDIGTDWRSMVVPGCRVYNDFPRSPRVASVSQSAKRS